MVEIGRRLGFKDRDAWRAWLMKHHALEKELWLVLYKKQARKPTVAYGDAVEEALCFGWIDGIVKKIDDKKYAIRFSPRRRGSIWSERNKQRVAKMIAQGRMNKVGLAKVEEAQRNGEWERPTRPENIADIPGEFKSALQANPRARDNFEGLSPSQHRMYIGWILDAKRDETRQRRIGAAIRMLEENRKLGIDTRMGDARGNTRKR